MISSGRKVRVGLSAIILIAAQTPGSLSAQILIGSCWKDTFSWEEPSGFVFDEDLNLIDSCMIVHDEVSIKCDDGSIWHFSSEDDSACAY